MAIFLTRSKRLNENSRPMENNNSVRPSWPTASLAEGCKILPKTAPTKTAATK
mgnify:CR=1 FL=1